MARTILGPGALKAMLLVGVVLAAGMTPAIALAQESKPAPQPTTQPEPTAPKNTPDQPSTPAAPAKPPATPPADQKKESLLYFSMKTSKGEIVLELNAEKAPISVANFKQYVEGKHYDGTIFHRVIDGFMIQGGGFTPDMQQKSTKAPIKNEWQNGLKNKRGTIAMARLGDSRPNPKTVDSATAQFFINVKDNNFLDDVQRDGGAYAVFGRVVAGMDVVDAIKGVKTTNKGGMGDVPDESVTINSVSAITADDAKKAIDAAKK
jgi:cyclophilin family peptidyl-prolyl cis-trans isomerase